jgi:hypothetical protein
MNVVFFLISEMALRGILLSHRESAVTAINKNRNRQKCTFSKSLVYIYKIQPTNAQNI